jgi:monovalent cation/proton antiporter MnhG/PhaG subunit
MTEPIGHALLGIGTVLAFAGSLAALRLPTFHARLGAATKAVSAGLVLLLAGTLFLPGFDRFGILAATAIFVVLITTPVLTAALARKLRPATADEEPVENEHTGETTVDMADDEEPGQATEPPGDLDLSADAESETNAAPDGSVDEADAAESTAEESPSDDRETDPESADDSMR